MTSRSLGIICDLDGTLYRSRELQAQFEEAYIAFVASALDLTRVDAIARVSMARTQLAAKNGITPSELLVLEDLGLEIAAWLSFSETSIRPEAHLLSSPGTAAALEKVRSSAWLDVTTNSSRRLAERILLCLGLSDFIDGVFSPEEYKGGKPAISLYMQISAMHGLKPERVLVLGDRWHIDLVGVSSLRMHGRLVSGPEEACSEMLRFVCSR